MKKHVVFILPVILLLICLGCEKAFIPENSNNYNLEDFEEAWQITNDQYPYFDLKGINWQELYDEYYPQAVASEGDEVYSVLLSMFAHLKDGHMYLETEGGQQLTPWIPPRRIKDLYAFNAALIGQYFEEDLLIDEEGNINYQRLPDNIGYINICSFSGKYNFGGLNSIFNSYKNTKGLIIDIRHNYGGNINNVDKVVGHLLTSPMLRHDYYFQDEKLQMDSIRPRGSYTYLNTVVVLVNGVSYSASEITTEIMKQINQVTVIGDTTGGGSLGYLNDEYNGDFRLPSGKLFHIGNLDVRKYDGQPYETVGIVPDILVPQTESDIVEGHDKQLEFAINYLKKK